jgi:hypothetical protein
MPAWLLRGVDREIIVWTETAMGMMIAVTAMIRWPYHWVELPPASQHVAWPTA